MKSRREKKTKKGKPCHRQKDGKNGRSRWTPPHRKRCPLLMSFCSTLTYRADLTVEEYVTVLDLYIDIVPLTKDEIIGRYGFNETQVAQFEQLLSSDAGEMWDEMIE